MRSKIVALALLILAALPASAQFEVARLLAHDGQQDDHFGEAVAIDGDTAVVGAPDEDGAGASSGAAYIFRLVGGNWTEEAKLIASDAAASVRFGLSVAIDGNRVVVGAPNADGANPLSGAAYVFRRAGSFPFATWTQQAKLAPASLLSGSVFGTSVSISGTAIAVGAPGVNGGGFVYLFRSLAAAWPEEARIPPTTGGGDGFGYCVAIKNDRVVFGIANQAEARVWTYANGSWAEEAVLLPPFALGYNFGESVDFDGTRAAFGAHGYTHPSPWISASGALVVYTRSGSQWSTPSLIEAATPVGNGRLGLAVAVQGTRCFGYENDTSSVSAPQVVLVFDEAGSSWTQTGALKPKSQINNGGFGKSIAVDGELVVVGCPSGSTSNGTPGSVLVISQVPPTPLVYCAAKVNSLGCTPSMSTQGSASATDPAPFTVGAQLVLNNKYGLLFFGTSGRTSFPFQGGTLCVLPPTRRTVTQNSAGNAPPDDCSGTYSFDFNSLIQSGVYPDLTAGVLVDSQYWSRDPASPSTTGLTNAVEFGIGF